MFKIGTQRYVHSKTFDLFLSEASKHCKVLFSGMWHPLTMFSLSYSTVVLGVCVWDDCGEGKLWATLNCAQGLLLILCSRNNPVGTQTTRDGIGVSHRKVP